MHWYIRRYQPYGAGYDTNKIGKEVGLAAMMGNYSTKKYSDIYGKQHRSFMDDARSFISKQSRHAQNRVSSAYTHAKKLNQKDTGYSKKVRDRLYSDAEKSREKHQKIQDAYDKTYNKIHDRAYDRMYEDLRKQKMQTGNEKFKFLQEHAPSDYYTDSEKTLLSQLSAANKKYFADRKVHEKNLSDYYNKTQGRPKTYTEAFKNILGTPVNSILTDEATKKQKEQTEQMIADTWWH